MFFSNIEEVQNQGFTGFITITDLQTGQDAYEQIPKEAGVYLILRLAQTEPEFLSVNLSRMHNKHKNKPDLHSYPVQALRDKYAKVKGSIVVYIGKAGGKKSDATIYSRLKAYMQAGLITVGSSSHSGGRGIWQLKDSSNLLVCWKVTHKDEAEELEKNLLKQFIGFYASLPLANRRN
jgi:hypothetical protein